jgi:hypothetical protein
LQKKTKKDQQMIEQEPKYPVGVQSFENIRQSGAVYVDKTDLIYKLTHKYEMVFMSRPRRFGKSLLVDTMAHYFNAQKELFKGLAMEKLEKEWTKYPVIRFNFGDVKGFDMFELRSSIELQLENYEDIYGANPKDVTLGNRFFGLIQHACKQTGQKVVVLIDEYDAPSQEVLTKPEKLEEVRNVMTDFYTQIKYADEYIRFAFMTGVSNYVPLGMFSGLNNLVNITDDDEYASICGITLQELKDNFGYGIRKFVEKEGYTPEEMTEKLCEQYGGYHFTDAMVDIINPNSLLYAFCNGELNSYWFETGTPALVINMLRARIRGWDFNIEDVEKTRFVSREHFLEPLALATDVLPFLYQSGYLTIKEKEHHRYVLGVPNKEVRSGLLYNLIPFRKILSAGQSC